MVEFPFYEEAGPSLPNRIEIHTSDRINFKRCRRKWNWQSTLRTNLIPIGAAVGPLWYGTGYHFAMEDYHGWKRFGDDPREAFAAYYDAFKPQDLPQDHDALLDLGFGMLEYYSTLWLPNHPDEYETLWVDGKPQVEVDVEIPLTDKLILLGTKVKGNLWVSNVLHKILAEREVVYKMTFDRVVIDSHERIWGVDYKTARQLDTSKLSTDPQAGAYHWGLAQFFGDQSEGVIWQQFLKAIPEPPKALVNGGFSQNKQQYTTHSVYRKALVARYGTVPTAYIEFLNFLAEQQTYEGDRFIRRDYIRRNPHQWRSEEEKILLEILDMLDPDLPLYPNPTRDCSWDCPFLAPCLATDDGSDPSFMLDTEYVKWKGYRDDWRERIVFPEETV